MRGNQTKTADRPQLRLDDASDPARLHRSLNDILLGIYQRIEATETASTLQELEDVTFETGGSVSPLVAPFAGGGVRATCPGGTPSGLVKLRLEIISPGGQPVSTAAHDVQWHFDSRGFIIVDYVSGLASNSKYRLRLGVTRHA